MRAWGCDSSALLDWQVLLGEEEPQYIVPQLFSAEILDLSETENPLDFPELRTPVIVQENSAVLVLCDILEVLLQSRLAQALRNFLSLRLILV